MTCPTCNAGAWPVNKEPIPYSPFSPRKNDSSGKFVSGMPCCIYFPAEAQRSGEEDGNLNPHPKI